MNNMLPRPRFWADAATQIKSRHTVFAEMMIYLLLSFIALLAQSAVIVVPVSGWMMKNHGNELMEAFAAGEMPQNLILELMKQMPDWMTVVTLISGGVIGAVAIIYCLKFQKRTLPSMGLCGKHPIGESLLGFLLGLVLAAAVVGIGVAAGGYRLASVQLTGTGILLLVLTLLGCLVYGASLELLTRGYFAPTVGTFLPVAGALVVSTLASAMMQTGESLFSLATANHLLLSLFLGILVLKRGNLWSACALHSAWLFAEGFLFDVAPAGAHGTIRLFEVDADLYRSVLSGGEYGPENSICATVILLAAVIVALTLRTKDPLPVEPEQPRED